MVGSSDVEGRNAHCKGERGSGDVENEIAAESDFGVFGPFGRIGFDEFVGLLHPVKCQFVDERSDIGEEFGAFGFGGGEQAFDGDDRSIVIDALHAEPADGLLLFVGFDVAQDRVAPLARIAVTVAGALEMEHGFLRLLNSFHNESGNEGFSDSRGRIAESSCCVFDRVKALFHHFEQIVKCEAIDTP